MNGSHFAGIDDYRTKVEGFMNKQMSILGGLGLGAGLMYILDPERGKRRRALVRDRFASDVSQLRHGMGKVNRDIRNRSGGVVAFGRKLVKGERMIDDEVLAPRVRSSIGRVVSHPHAIEVSAQDGVITLRGPILEDELDPALTETASVPGVKRVKNLLEVHAEPGDVPGLQGGRPRDGRRSELMQDNWTPALRLLVGTGGSALTLHAIASRGILGTVTGLAGATMLARAITNKNLKRIAGFDSRPSVDIQKTIHIKAPVKDVFSFLANFQNLPRFMSHLREVRDLGGGRTRWVSDGPAGMPMSWDVEVTDYIPNQMVVWRSSTGSPILNVGSIRFDPDAEGGTRITVRLSYNPPAGAVGHVVASLFGADPRKEMDDDFVRLKSLIELGRTRANGKKVYREELEAPAPDQTRMTIR
jgi:uncharacterized membrane protein